ncbi:MAG: hypothetical protein US39_C0016G0002 [Microgenomates group bacterium GW2011_GWC1_37_12b]|uniref:DNA alkylation repair protein n=1 Tax=Candidatus Woesebacteria bacterium GW2011_GWB1_38_8b TaxID=1618571 RepID=A0A0G0L4X3_9BACT|nr:MAG: hypothetical protein US39_C0016G0002 [Microgenomates group bacterium GW2011_GWC1_37_12b]KKQ87043.1 MAG: hypothetical protein UT10_C0012G0031 [Candidatus Woesebacteria bacterium GW2011_GWB1_38_8b]
MSVNNLISDLKSVSQPERIKDYQRFFKTGKGDYGEGDIFIGVTVPKSRIVAKKYKDLTLTEISKLLRSKIHEVRLIALIILVNTYNKSSDKERAKIFNFYLANTKYINNWDLVDLSAHKIVGEFLWRNPKKRHKLNELAKSGSLWERRIAVISTFYFINNNSYEEPLYIAEILLSDSHDLIHKAVGWMLREVGKRDQKLEEGFLKKHYRQMPRTCLRYAIEKFPENLRKKYLQGKI